MTNYTLLFIFYLISISFICVELFIILKKNLLNKDLLFYLFTTYILNIAVSLFYFYFNNLNSSLVFSLFLMVISFVLLLEIKRVLKKTPVLSIPYFLFTIFLFSNIVNQYLGPIH